MRWDEPLARYVGDRTAKALATALELHTVEDLLRHYPRRYLERGELTDLGSLVPGEHVTVQAEVVASSTRPMKNRRGTIEEVLVTDGVGRLKLVFFNQAWRIRKGQLVEGSRGLFAGRVERRVVKGRIVLELTQPETVAGDEVEDIDAEEYADTLTPVYPASSKASTLAISKALRMLLAHVDDLDDPLPEDVRRARGLLPLADALRMIHAPADLVDVEPARERLRFEEAYVLQVVLAQRRHETTLVPAQPRRARSGGLVDAFEARLPFTLTAGQREIGAVVADELALEHPMHRLLQGEVGSGKTVVALRAMLTVVDDGGQAALLAPTEVLAQQHHRSVLALLGPLAERGLLGGSDVGTRVALLTGSLSSAARRAALLDAVSGDAGILIGTHALLEERVEFRDLGLVVVDEQHRFGVEQRAALAAKGATPPHVLVMTATPIPRTVAMTVFGDLEVSTLRELPAGRAGVTTHVVPAAEKPHYLERAWQRVREEVAAGRQAYVVTPRIGDAPGDAEEEPPLLEEDEDIPRRPARGVLEVAEELRAGPLAGLRVEIMHGRLSAEAKDEVMRAFVAGEVDVLVATTVIEVGVDVANASTMVVVDADRFGVSQLHQLRGRVGRGAHPGVCLLVTEVEAGTPAADRLDAVAQTSDGFELSRVDLEQRREGDVLGATQSGRRSSLRLLSVLRHEDVIVDARAAATETVAVDPALRDHPGLAAAVERLAAAERADYLDKS